MMDILDKLETKIIGKKIHKFEEIDSTNDEAKRLISQGAVEGEVIIANCQSSGRGRMGRAWFSKPGGIYLTIILKPFINQEDLGQITLLASLCVVRGITGLTSLSAFVRWPNDILISGKKAGGVLCEIENGNVIVGIGVDVNQEIDSLPQDLRESITTIKGEIGKEIDIARLVKVILEEFDSLYIKFLKEGFNPIKKEWELVSSTLGKWIKVSLEGREIEGSVFGIGEKGELILKAPDGSIQKVTAGDVIYVKY